MTTLQSPYACQHTDCARERGVRADRPLMPVSVLLTKIEGLNREADRVDQWPTLSPNDVYMEV